MAFAFGQAEPVILLSPTDVLSLVVGLATGVATFVGGAVALRYGPRIPLILGFSAGAVIGVALFDLVPESLELARHAVGPVELLGLTAIGFGGYMLLERLLNAASQVSRGHLGPASLAVHSLLDGVAIGLAFKAAPAIGLVVALAVLAHDIADGINTVTLALAAGGGPLRARRWLVVDALAPMVGILATRFITVSQATLGLLTAVFAGFFLYIGASELVPSSHRALPRLWTSIATLAGMAAIYAVVQLASGLG